MLFSFTEAIFKYFLFDYWKNQFGLVDFGKDVQIDFVGVCTGICVISNVMLAKAFCTNADIRVIANACACVSPKSHNTALEAMKTCQVDIL